MEILKVDKLSLSFGGLQVLNNICFGLHAGEKVALIGPNGAGKTTVLNVLNGLLKPLSGRIVLNNRDITELPTHRRASLGLARSFQTSSLYSGLTVISNVLLSLHGIQKTSYHMLRPITSYQDKVNKANELLDSVNLLSKRDCFPTALCHGEQRLLELILSLASHPSVLMLDEPTAGLTTIESAELAKMLRSQANKDIAVLFVAHDLDLVFEVAERILVLFYGRIIAEGTPEQIQTNKTVREIYLGARAGAGT